MPGILHTQRHTPAVKQKPSALPSTCFGWVWTTLNYAESDIIRECGKCGFAAAWLYLLLETMSVTVKTCVPVNGPAF